MALCNTLFHEIETLEIDSTLLFFHSYTPGEYSKIFQKYTPWKKKYESMKFDLYSLLTPHSSKTMIEIYGSKEHLINIVKTYLDIIKTKEWKAKVQTVWFHEEYYNELDKKTKKPLKQYKYLDYELPLKSNSPHDILVGAVIGVNGLCSHLYFQEEEGLHMVKEDDQELKYYLTISQKILDDTFRAPDGIHRRKYFQEFQSRRTYQEDFLEDKNYKINESGTISEMLRTILNRRIETKLDLALCGFNTKKKKKK